MKNSSILLFMFILFLPILGFAGWSWQNPYPQPNELHDFFFIDANRGWAVGNEGTMLYSIDGGATWEQQFFGRIQV